MTVHLAQAWPPYGYWWVCLNVTEDGETEDYLITVDQARVLGRALRVLVAIHDRAAS